MISKHPKRSEIRARVAELVRRRAVLAELDDAWVLMQLKAIARNGVALGECIDRFAREENGDPRVLQSTMIKLRAIAGVVRANELLGKYLGMWKDEAGLTNPTDCGPSVIEVYWKGSPQETLSEPNGPRMLSEQPCSNMVPENLGIPNIAAQRIDEKVTGYIHHPEDRGPSQAADVKNPARRKWGSGIEPGVLGMYFQDVGDDLSCPTGAGVGIFATTGALN
jgi:hypothetical protein